MNKPIIITICTVLFVSSFMVSAFAFTSSNIYKIKVYDNSNHLTQNLVRYAVITYPIGGDCVVNEKGQGLSGTCYGITTSNNNGEININIPDGFMMGNTSFYCYDDFGHICNPVNLDSLQTKNITTIIQ